MRAARNDWRRPRARHRRRPYPARAEPTNLRLRRAKIKGCSALACQMPRSDGSSRVSASRCARRPIGGMGCKFLHGALTCAREVDLIEEVARHYGFDRLPSTFRALTVAPPPVDPRIGRARHLRTRDDGAGFSEAMTFTFGFMASAAAAPFAPEGDLVPIANPLSENFAVLRPSALPGLIDAVAHNRRREQRDVRLFEIGNRFSRGAGERRALACAWSGAARATTGAAAPAMWTSSTSRASPSASATRSGSNPHRTTRGEMAGSGTGRGRSRQRRARRHHRPARPRRSPTRTVFRPARRSMSAELDLDALDEAAGSRSVRVEPLPRYPSVTRDISILVDEHAAGRRGSRHHSWRGARHPRPRARIRSVSGQGNPRQ